MIASFLLVATQVGTLFLMMAAGFVLAKKNLITSTGVPQITTILLNVVTPCIIVNALQTAKNAELLVEMGQTALGMIGIMIVSILIGKFMFRKQPHTTRSPLLFAVIYGNTGFMGLPLVEAVLGDEALIYGSVIFVVFIIFNWSHGVVLMGGKKYLSAKHILINPGVLGSIVGIFLFWFEITLPDMVGNAVAFLASSNTSMAMVVIGAQMAWADFGATFRKPILYQAAAMRLVVIPLLTTILLLPFSLSPLVYCSLVILSAVPAAGATAMFAVRYNCDEETSVQLITLTTLLSMITLPLFGALSHYIAYL